MRQDSLYLVAISARQRQQAVVNLQCHLSDHERSVLEKQIVRLEYAAPLRVLDRDQREVDGLIGNAVKGMPQRSKSLWLRCREGGVQRLFGVSARFPLIADRELACDARNSIERNPILTLPKFSVEGFEARPGLVERQEWAATDPDRLAEFLISQAVGVRDRAHPLDIAEERVQIVPRVADHDDDGWCHPRRRPK